MNKSFIVILILLTIINTSCTSKTLDINTLDFKKSATTYNLSAFNPSKITTQKGYYEVEENGDDVSIKLVDNGTTYTTYLFDEKAAENINFHGLPVEQQWVNQIGVYEDQIAYINIVINELHLQKLVENLNTTLGNPDDVIYNTNSEEAVDKNVLQKLKTAFPSTVKTIKDEISGNLVIEYPERIFWNKADRIYSLTINPLNAKPSLVIISKKAFKDKVVMGYHNPQEDPYLAKYIK